MASNKQTTILKTNTFEELRQKANEVSLRLGDNDQLDSLLEDKVYNYTASADQIRFLGSDNDSDTLSFEISPQNTVDNTAGYIILHGSPTIPAGFIADATLTQTNGYQATITSVTSSKILVRNSSGTFDSSLDINVGSDSISASNVRRILGESYDTAVARVYVNGSERSQDMSADGFHVPTYIGYVELQNLSSGDVDDFIEGETVYQGTSLNASTWSGTILECSLTVLRLKTQTGSFSASTQIKVTNSSDTIAGANHTGFIGVSTLSGSIIEFNTPLSNLDTVKIKAVDLVQAINELQDDIGEVENLTTVSNDLVQAINEHDSELGTISSGNMGTTASTVETAIREHEDQIGNVDITAISSVNDTITGALSQLHTEVGSLSLNTTANDLTAAINEHETDIGTVGNLTTSATNLTLAINELDLKQGAATLTTSANTLSGAVNELDAELGTITSGAMGTTASTVSGAIAEHETQIGNVDITAISSTNDTITGALSQLHTEVGTLSLNTTATNLTAAINEHESDIGNMTLTGVSATNLSAAVRELASEKVDLTSASTQTISSPLTVSGNVTYSNNSGNDTFTFEAGTTLDLSDVDGSTGVTLLLPGSATGVSTFGTAFLATDSTENVQGFRIDRGGVAGAPTPYPTLQWDETVSDEEKRWQARGLDTSGTSSRADSLVTFYNAFHLIQNNTESGINVTWDSANQNFDFDVSDFTVTLGTGPISGSFTVNNLANATFNTTLDNDSVTLGTHTTGAYVRRILGTSNEIEVSSNDVETASVTIGLPNAVDIGDLDVTDTTQSSSSTTGALTVAGGAGIAKNLYVGGDLFVQGTQTVLNTATLTVEDTLVLAGNNLSSEPSSGGFGLEVGPITNPSGVASNVTGAHSIVYNYATDRWEADGSLILSEATLGSPDVKANGTSVGDLTPSRSIDFLNGTGITAAVTYDSGTSDFNVVFTNTDLGSSQAIFKNIQTDNGTATANINNDTLVLSGGNAINTSRSGDTITIAHNDTSTLNGSYGGNDNGVVIEDITVDSNGHVTGVGTRDLDGRFYQQSSFASANTASAPVIRDSSGNFSAGTITASLTGNASSATQVYVTTTSTNTSYRLALLTNSTVQGSGNHDIYKDSSATGGVNYNPSTNVLSASTFSGSLSGNATSATDVYLHDADGVTGNTDYYIPFSDYNASNGDAAHTLFGKGTLKYRPGTDQLHVGSVYATFVGNGASVTNLSGTNIATGTVSATRIASLDASKIASGTFATARIPDLDAGKITTGTFATARIPTNINITGNAATATSATSAGSAASCTGNSATATTLQTARTIGGVSFNGSANINLPGVNTAGNQNTSGNAASATVLQTARTIGGVSFNGSANINLPGVNTAGNQNTSGNAASATLATKASTLSQNGGNGSAMTFNWSGQSGQPSWLWGSNNGTDIYVYNPSNFSVNYATSAGSASSASSATNATNASYIYTYSRSSENVAYYLMGNPGSLNGNGSANASTKFYFNPSASAIYSTGDIVAYVSSDRNLKENIKPIENALDKVSKINGVTFDWKDSWLEKHADESLESGIIRKNDTGVIAQEVQEVLPEVVHEREDGTLGVKYEKMIGLLIESIKELKEQNNELRSEIEKLKSINS